MTNQIDKPDVVDREAKFLALFDSLVDVMFCCKDLGGCYTEVNLAFVHRSGRRSKRDVIGATATDLFPGALARRYEQQDRRVFSTDSALRDALELVRRPDGSTGWYLTTKLPLHARRDHQVIGLVSVSRDLRTPSERGITPESLEHVVEVVRARLSEKMTVADLAAIAGCSTAQLARRMKKVFGLSTSQYVTRVRVDAAAQMLIRTDEAVAAVAAAAGFYDQASFSRHFARLTGETPVQFRLESRRRREIIANPLANA